MISATYGTNSSLSGVFSGFGILQNALANSGKGICITNITKANFDDVAVQYFDKGIDATDSILLTFNRIWIELNTTGVRGLYASNSPPNGWNIANSHFSSQGAYSIFLGGNSAGGAQGTNIIGNDFESNGTLGGFSTIYNQYDPSAYGGLGLNIAGNYFEGNKGTEITFGGGGGANLSGVLNVKNNVFGRSLSGLGAGISVLNNGIGTAQKTVNVGGNGFSDVLLTGASFQWLGVQTPATTNYTFACTVPKRNGSFAECANCKYDRVQ